MRELSKRIYTTAELARLWGVSTKKLEADRLSGRGCRFVKFGRAVRYRIEDIEAHESACLRGSTSEVRS